jgi:putative alpha-1,2-mannosidase
MRWTRRLRLCVAGAVTASALFTVPVAQAAQPSDARLTDLVNPFIGTENEGNTYPGAAVPFGMVQFSPDTGHNTGYDHSDDHIRGFSLIHLSGVGCGLGGDLPVLPTMGDVTETDYAKYAAEFSHDDEEASPGYYRVGSAQASTPR